MRRDLVIKLTNKIQYIDEAEIENDETKSAHKDVSFSGDSFSVNTMRWKSETTMVGAVQNNIGFLPSPLNMDHWIQQHFISFR